MLAQILLASQILLMQINFLIFSLMYSSINLSFFVDAMKKMQLIEKDEVCEQ